MVYGEEGLTGGYSLGGCGEGHMTAKNSEPAKAVFSSRLWTVLSLTAVLGLAGCASVDSMLFGSDAPQADAQPAAREYAPPPANTAAPAALPGTVAAPIPTITPISVEPGADTGTAVGKATAELRTKISDLQGAIRQNAQKFAAMRNSGAAASMSYYEFKGHITTRLQIGTTRGNPELVSEWNRAQAALDQLTGNINGLNALAKDVANDASTAHYTLDQIAATLDLSGAVDEDHRQLRVLEDETNQTIVLIDRLLREVSDDVQRQTAYVANERANLTTLAGAIKNGEFYGTDFGTQIVTSSLASPRARSVATSGAPLVVIKFDRADTNYQKILYSALRQTLQSRPGASFKVVAVSPSSGSLADSQLAQTTAYRHAQDVVQSMTDMGVPPSRVSIAASTDPSIGVSQVQVFAR